MVTFAGSGGSVGFAGDDADAPVGPAVGLADGVGAVPAEDGQAAAATAAAKAAPASRPLSATAVSRREGRRVTVLG